MLTRDKRATSVGYTYSNAVDTTKIVQKYPFNAGNTTIFRKTFFPLEIYRKGSQIYHKSRKKGTVAGHTITNQ
ncbi:hypothetical protein [Ktedonobacter racemifer]|uniref:Uncharacterized protein n=1 Tax=Ktedonobacter racemifer DSM 44963 TaxID=485913 RepID=D6U6G3_KTERA|nr:hypothetical protein [Ktedonobacter racemifer]EFH80574.1 hypothetical protein Krac_1189 [Ktedonobacter racemifer DSM 44963]